MTEHWSIDSARVRQEAFIVAETKLSGVAVAFAGEGHLHIQVHVLRSILPGNWDKRNTPNIFEPPS